MRCLCLEFLSPLPIHPPMRPTTNEDFLIRLCSALLLSTAFLLAGCNATPHTSVSPSALRNYHGSASIGDFLSITVNPSAQTITYNDASNGESGTIPYTVNSNGTYTLNNPGGNLTYAYEIPNHAVLIQADKTGPNRNTLALVTAVESTQISAYIFEGQAYNYMQLRTSGGVNIGSITINPQGAAAISSYWPYGALRAGNGGQSPFSSSGFDLADAQLDTSGTFLKMLDPGGSGNYDYVFGTANGVFAVDNPNGTILGLLKAGSKDFQPSFAGIYTAMYYQKTNARTGNNNRETGTPGLGDASIVVTSSGQITITDSHGSQMAQGTLSAVADTSYLYGRAGELQDPCWGLFTLRITSATSQQDVFVNFLNNSMLFSSFSANLPSSQGGTYNYFYGVGLRW